jgi:hypothetical protein
MERTPIIGHKHGGGQLSGSNDTPITCSFNYIVSMPTVIAPELLLATQAPGRGGFAFLLGAAWTTTNGKSAMPLPVKVLTACLAQSASPSRRYHHQRAQGIVGTTR